MIPFSALYTSLRNPVPDRVGRFSRADIERLLGLHNPAGLSRIGRRYLADPGPDTYLRVLKRFEDCTTTEGCRALACECLPAGHEATRDGIAAFRWVASGAP